jgi:hypothetical protein
MPFRMPRPPFVTRQCLPLAAIVARLVPPVRVRAHRRDRGRITPASRPCRRVVRPALRPRRRVHPVPALR